MNIKNLLRKELCAALHELYKMDMQEEALVLNATKKEFSGDITLVLFPIMKQTGVKLNELANSLSKYLTENSKLVLETGLVSGFLNMTLKESAWTEGLGDLLNKDSFVLNEAIHEKLLIEFSSPNTNKPLHLGHIRNILLGWSMSNIFELAGYEVFRVQIINDRGIAICKSMVAWLHFANGETPESSGIAGDQLVGKYYVLFETESKKQAENLPEDTESELMTEAREMLLKWEANDPEVRKLWATMNGWVYEGHNTTYDRLGVRFDKLYYESETYLLGKTVIEKGLSQNVFYKKDDSSVWIDLTEAGLDHKLVLRSDGTAVYITQDIGTAMVRYDDFKAKNMVYVVANEQDYHFQVLFEIMKRMGEPFARGLYHLSYAMVDLPSGKMKTREGTVVDANELMDEMIEAAVLAGSERGLLNDINESDRKVIFKKIGMAALKYFILRVHPRKRIVFDPAESLDMQGQTGPYIQNAYVRIASIARKAGNMDLQQVPVPTQIEAVEKELIMLLWEYPESVKSAARQYNPSEIANYCYSLAKAFHRYYHEYPVIQHPDVDIRNFRLYLCKSIAEVLEHSMNILGIELPERM